MLVLATMLLFVFFIIAALAVDFSQMSINVEQGTQTAKFASLAALQGYTVSSKQLTRAERLEIARAQANETSGLNLGLTMGGKSQADALESLGSGPKLIAGKYYAEVPESYCSAPCTQAQNVPCFVPLADVKLNCEPPGTTAENVQPNSFRIMGQYFSDLRTMFARIAGGGSYQIPVDVVAAFTPRRGMFLVDISASTFRETHWYTKTAPEYPSYYSYYLQADNPVSPGSFYDDGSSGSWPTLPPNRLAPPPAPAPMPTNSSTRHFQSDYAIVSSGAFPAPTVSPTPNYTGKTNREIVLLKDANFGDAGENFNLHHPNPVPGATPYPVNLSDSQQEGVFRVDTYRDANYAGPEPFTTIFQGLNSAVTAFKERAVTGDRLGIIFFDEKLTWSRVIKLTADFSYIGKFTDLSTLDNNDHGLQRVLRHGIFPSKNSMSNIVMAAGEALRQFDEQQISNASSVDFMVYFGDGLANCVANPAAVGTGAQACGEDYFHYRQAISELKTFANNVLFPRQISFNVILMGSHVGPHVLATGDDGGHCYTDTEARNLKLPFVKGGIDGKAYPSETEWAAAYNNMSATAPFYQVNDDMYQIARLTGGIWGPVRKSTTSEAQCHPACADSNPPRAFYSCQTPTADVDSYIKDEIMNANPYMIVPGSASAN